MEGQKQNTHKNLLMDTSQKVRGLKKSLLRMKISKRKKIGRWAKTKRDGRKKAKKITEAKNCSKKKGT